VSLLIDFEVLTRFFFQFMIVTYHGSISIQDVDSMFSYATSQY